MCYRYDAWKLYNRKLPTLQCCILGTCYCWLPCTHGGNWTSVAEELLPVVIGCVLPTAGEFPLFE